MIRVGHASPACVFTGVDVFGGEAEPMRWRRSFDDAARRPRSTRSVAASASPATLATRAEETDFVRLNRGKVRQPGDVAQRYVEIRADRGARHASHAISLVGQLRRRPRRGAGERWPACAACCPTSPTIPTCCCLDGDVERTERRRPAAALPKRSSKRCCAPPSGQDLVGLLAAGPVYRASRIPRAAKLARHRRHSTSQWSLFYRADKAVKSSYCGFDWNDQVLNDRMTASAEQLALVAARRRPLAPGKYRAYLAPAAMDEVAGMLAWGGFSGRALATQQSSLARMRANARLDPRVQIERRHRSRRRTRVPGARVRATGQRFR